MVQSDSRADERTETSTFHFGTWYPIETAPKDGSDALFFVLGFGMGFQVLYWTDGYWREKANGMGLKIHPSHWMPLPPPPSSVDREVSAKSDAGE